MWLILMEMPEPLSSDAQYRNLLLHYVPIFTVQGEPYAAFGRRLKAIANSSNQEFAHYLSRGDTELSSMRRGRAGFDWKGTRYVGTFFDDCVWPEWLTGIPTPSKNGAFFWGLASEALDRFQNGQVADLDFPNEEAIVELRGNIFSIEMPDWSVLIWGPTQSELTAAADREAVCWLESGGHTISLLGIQVVPTRPSLVQGLQHALGEAFLATSNPSRIMTCYDFDAVTDQGRDVFGRKSGVERPENERMAHAVAGEV